MRYIQTLFAILLLVLLLIISGVSVFAIDTVFSTEVLSEEDIETFLGNILISPLENEPSKKGIECFDVNENGLIAIGCSDSENKTICLYTIDGDFQYGYSFHSSGDFGIELGENVLHIYFVRSDVALTVDLDGNVESVEKIRDTFENNSYWNHVVFATRRKMGDREYVLKNGKGIFNVFVSSYSQLVTINADGEEDVIYDASSVVFPQRVIVFIGVVTFVGIVIAGVVSSIVKGKRKTQ